jgi:N-acetylglutamate synthase-like GNAT family acetyltransferase
MGDLVITLRPAGADDWSAIERLLLENKLPTDGAQDHLEAFVVADGVGGLVGCAGLEHHDRVGLLRSVAVASSARGKGIGERLSKAILSQARERELSHVYLLTTTAASYFARQGFAQVTRDAAPSGLRASAEFQGACPASATLMALDTAQDREL